MERKYYLIDEGNELAEKVSAFIFDMKKVTKDWESFRHKYGGATCWHHGNYMIGLAFDASPPDGWYSPKTAPDMCYEPRSNRVASRDAYKEFKNLPRQKTGLDFSNLIGFAPVNGAALGGGIMVHYAVFEFVGDTIVVSLPEDGEPPVGLKQLKKSQYWSMKEAA